MEQIHPAFFVIDLSVIPFPVYSFIVYCMAVWCLLPDLRSSVLFLGSTQRLDLAVWPRAWATGVFLSFPMSSIICYGSFFLARFVLGFLMDDSDIESIRSNTYIEPCNAFNEQI